MPIAREEGETGKWFVGAITNKDGREIAISLDFLTPGVTYVGTIYKDGNDAHWNENPIYYEIEKTEVNASVILPLKLAPGEGFAISIIKK